MNKRGLNQVIIVALIILLAIAALLALWMYLRGALFDIGEDINTQCITLDLQPIACVIRDSGTEEFPVGCEKPNWVAGNNIWYGDNFSDNTPYSQVKVERISGDNANVKTIKVFYTLADGSEIVREMNNTPSGLETKLTFPPQDLTNETFISGSQLKSVKIAAVLDAGRGRNYTCGYSVVSECEKGDVYFDSAGTTTAPNYSLNPFWSLGDTGADGWKLNRTTSTFIFPVSSSGTAANSFVANVSGDFIIELGFGLNVTGGNAQSTGFVLEEPNDIAPKDHIGFRWDDAPERLEVSRDSNHFGGMGTVNRTNMTSPNQTDLKLTRVGDRFTWEYRFHPYETSWRFLRNETASPAYDPVLQLILDNGRYNEIRYVKIQSAGGQLPCSET